MLSPKMRGLHPTLGKIYFVAISVSCTSAILIAVSEWSRLWFFLFLAVGTYSFAIVGYVAGKRRKGHWLIMHVIGLTSSYCGMVMAFLVSRFGMIRMVPSLGRFPFFVRLAPLMFIVWSSLQTPRPRSASALPVNSSVRRAN